MGTFEASANAGAGADTNVNVEFINPVLIPDKISLSNHSKVANFVKLILLLPFKLILKFDCNFDSG